MATTRGWNAAPLAESCFTLKTIYQRTMMANDLIRRLRAGTYYDQHALMNEAADTIEDLRQVLRMVDDNNRVDAGEDRKAWRGAFVDAEVRRVLGDA